MKLTFEQVENILKRKMKNSQLIFGVAVFLAMGVFLYSRELMYLFMSFYFVVLGALTLPNINKCKGDINDFKKDDLNEVTGKVLDLFPEKEKIEDSKNWYIFVQVGENEEYVEFSLPQKPDELITVEKVVKVRYTKATQLPVEIKIAE